eukprot:gene3988-4363_t
MIVILVTLISILIFAIFFKRSQKTRKSSKSIAFFHPYCDNGGGGERVLWVAIAALLEREANRGGDSLAERQNVVRISIYTGDIGKSKETILKNVKSKFGIAIPSDQATKLDLIYIHWRTLLSAEWYPVATMIGQSIGTMIVVLECLWRHRSDPPDIFCDTMGAAFGYPLVKLFTSAKVVAYVHYPIISTDMLARVREQRPSYNNQSAISSSTSVSSLKLLYYHLFAWAYGWVGQFADSVIVNSSWTRKHIQDLWSFPPSTSTCNSMQDDLKVRRLQMVYPPCNTTALETIALPRPLLYGGGASSEKWKHLIGRVLILSIGQFRPEKDHFLQLQIVEELVKEKEHSNIMLLMMGSVRNEDDEKLVYSLKLYIEKHGLSANVEIIVNAAYSDMLFFLANATIGLHTMWNEHFGISVVEMMAAGLIVVAHNSGGPASDIILSEQTGYLASTVDEYVRCIRTIMRMDDSDRKVVQEASRASIGRYADAIFAEHIRDEFAFLLRRIS